METYKNFQFLNTLFLHSVLALICTLLCSYPFWFQNLCSSINHFAFVCVANFSKSFFFNPKFLFIVGNAIIIFLVGESKLSNSSSSPAAEIYDEYVRKSLRNVDFSSQMEKKEEENLGMKFSKQESVKKIVEEREEEEDSGLETEELNKRVEDFIARVNRQRWLEAKFEDCGRG